jgi:hypothetical protein
VILREERRLSISENMVLGSTFGPKRSEVMVGGGWRKLHNNQPGVVKQSKMEGSCKMYWRDEECNRDLVRKPDGQRY